MNPVTRKEALLSQLAGKGGGSIRLQSKSATPSDSAQTITADSGYDGLRQVDIAAIPAEYVVPTGSVNVAQNGTVDVTQYASASVSVPNTYAAGDEGKVVDNGALVAQTALTVTENGTVDTTLKNSVTVNVSGGADENKPVKFIDYDGTLLYSYTPEEFAALEEMPALVSHTGMAAATAWNWSLADAKAYVAINGMLYIGQEYEYTEFDLELSGNALSPYINIGVNGTVDIVWGDGTSDEVSGSRASQGFYTGHTYTSASKKTIRIVPHEGAQYIVSPYDVNGSSRQLFAKDPSASANRNIYMTAFVGVRFSQSAFSVSSDSSAGYLAFYYAGIPSVSFPSGAVYIYRGSESSIKNISIPNSARKTHYFNNCRCLEGITLPAEWSTLSSATERFENCTALKYVVMSQKMDFYADGAFKGCTNLKKVILPTKGQSIPANTFNGCANLTSLVFPASYSGVCSIYNAFSGCTGMMSITFLSTTPPRLQGSYFSSFPFPECVIYVPYSADHSVLNAYKSATNWSTYADYIQELPEE